MSHSTRFRRSSAGYTGYGSGVGVGLASLGGGGLSSLPPSSALSHLSVSSSSHMPSTQVGSGGGAGGYTSTYTTAAANSYLRNYGNDLIGIVGGNGARDAHTAAGTGRSAGGYSSPGRRMQQQNRYDGSKIDSMLAAAGITTSSTSAVNSVTSVNSKSAAVTAPVGIRSTLRSYRRGGGGGVTTGTARSHQELSSLDDRLLSGAGDLSTSLDRRGDILLPPSISNSSSWRVKSAGGALTSYGGDLHTERVSRINNDTGYGSGEVSAFRRRDPSLTRSEILGPSSSSLAGNAINIPSYHREEPISSSHQLLSGSRDRHFSSNSLMRAEELERDFEQYVVRPNNATGIREKSVLREAGIETPTRSNYPVATGGGTSRPLSRALVNDGYGEVDGSDGILEGVHRARSPLFSSSAPLRSASRTRRDVDGHNYGDRTGGEGSRMQQHSRLDPFDARGRASEPFDERHSGTLDRRDLYDGGSNSHNNNHHNKDAFDGGPRTPSRHGRATDRDCGRSGFNERRRGASSSCNNGRHSAGIVRSNSFKDLRDFEDPHCGPRPSPSAGKSPRARHQTLAYGVSSNDLEVARGGSAGGHGRRSSTGGLHMDAAGAGGSMPGSTSRDFAAEWRSSHQVPIVSNAVPGVVSFKANKELQGFASDMSVVNSSANPVRFQISAILRVEGYFVW